MTALLKIYCMKGVQKASDPKFVPDYVSRVLAKKASSAGIDMRSWESLVIIIENLNYDNNSNEKSVSMTIGTLL